MYIGERFERNGKTYEVTSVFGSNYGFKEVEAIKVEVPVFKDEEPEEEPVEEPEEEPEEEVKEEVKEPVRRGRKKKV